MQHSKGLSAISYLSILFAPFLLPLIVFFVTKDHEVKYHAKRAFLSHLIPTILGMVFAFLSIVSIFMFSTNESNAVFYIFMIITILYVIIMFAVTIWNIIQAARVLKQNIIHDNRVI